MGRALTPAERRELLGAYALGALDDDERAQVEELLLDDASARAELHTLQLGVAWLDHASTRAPMHVWQDIVHQIETEAGEAQRSTMAPPTLRRPRTARVLALAAALLVGIVVAGGVLLTRDEQRAPTVAALAARAAERPGATTTPLRDADGERAGEVVVTPGGRAYLVWSDAPDPVATDRAYQLWELTPDGPRSAGLLGRAPADRAFRVGSSTSGVAVTSEQRGGSEVPTGAPAVVATFA